MQHHKFKFSIITVSLNNAETIVQTIESVLSQEFGSFEYLVLDGGSTDKTLEILKSYGDKLKWISEPDKGIYNAMNKGWQMAQGEFVAYLNADDFYNHTQVLAKMSQTLDSNKLAMAGYGDLAYVESNHTEKIIRYWKTGTYNVSSFLKGWMPPHPTFFLKREAFEKFGGFRDEILKSAADYELILRMLFKNKLLAVYCPDILVRMRVGGVSNRNFENRIRGNKEDRLAWDLNQLKPFWFTLWLKPLRKVVQFVQRPSK